MGCYGEGYGGPRGWVHRPCPGWLLFTGCLVLGPSSLLKPHDGGGTEIVPRTEALDPLILWLLPGVGVGDRGSCCGLFIS